MTARERERRRRFLRAAAGRGFAFSTDVYGSLPAWRRSYPRWTWQLATVSLIVGIAGAIWVNRATRVELLSLPAISEAAAVARPDESFDPAILERAALHLDIERARRAERASAARAAERESARQALETRISALRHELAAAGVEQAATQARLGVTQQALDKVTGELSDARRQNASDAMLLELQGSRLAALSTQVRESDEQLTRQRQLLAANRDIRDLMGARNLHVIDVFDVDGRGKTRRAFGRAFYTEGKSLIFYAFDLTTAAASPASFQAWGQREDGGTSALSLGLLYADDQTQNRWTLKFEDARVLEQIDAVFVTVEPPGGSRSPRGRKLLYAYLRQRPNHP